MVIKSTLILIVIVIYLSCFEHIFLIVNVSLWCWHSRSGYCSSAVCLDLPYALCCFRSSDSDGAFETPESTTPVKTASPIDPPTQPLLADGKGNADILLSIFGGCQE